MTAARKFAFDMEFAADGRILRAGDEVRLTFTKDEVAELEAEAYARGREDALVRAEEIAGQHLRQIASQMQFLFTRLGEESASMRRECAEAAVAAAETIAGVALDRFGREAVEAIAGEAIAMLRDAAHIRIATTPELVETLRPRLEQLAEATGYAGRLVVSPDPTRRPGDCEIAWADGLIVSDRAEAAQKIRDAAQRWLDDHDAGPAQFDLFAEESAR